MGGSKWDAKRCAIKVGLEKTTRRPVQGDKVKLSKLYKFFDGEGLCLKPGQIGTLMEDDRTSVPFLVEAPGGGSDWYSDGAITIVDVDNLNAVTPLGDSLEGGSYFSRFPVPLGTWYSEIEVAKMGKSQPCVGFGLMKKSNPKKAERIMVIGGKSGVKLDYGEGSKLTIKEQKKKA